MIKKGGEATKTTAITYISIIGTFAIHFTEDSIVRTFLDLTETGGNRL
jgi:hypothetical protein